PAFVTKGTDLSVAARRITFGKYFNCGQSCIAPDYLIVERGLEDKLLAEVRNAILEFYGASPQTSDSLGRIVNLNHFHRLKNMLDKTKGNVVIGGDSQESDLYIAPTVVLGVTPEDELMQQEIFGPIMPIMIVDTIDEGIDYVNDHDQPLSLYVFSTNKKVTDHILDNTRSGGAVVNDVLSQFLITNLPFGGTGPSGFGSYHGQASFDTFSHARSTLIKSLGMERVNNLRYPPYTDKKISWASWALVDGKKYSNNASIPDKESKL
ncbi:Aldehyde dehydrogenase, partial [Podila epigama]